MKTFSRGRRAILVGGAVAGSGLVLGFWLWKSGGSDPTGGQTKKGIFRPNAWVRVGTDGVVTIIVAAAEMGQGVWTSLPMLVAEELEVDWKSVRIEQASSDPEFGFQVTGGSYSIRGNWQVLREAGATARMMLVAAAADIWKAPVTECRAEQGMVMHISSGRQLPYAELAAVATRQPVPSVVNLKQPGDYRLIGRPLAQLDSADKVTGGIVYGIDVRIPGMLTAVITHCPVFGGKPSGVNGKKALAVEGVLRVVQIDSGVAVVADDYWSARKGLEALEVQWDMGAHAHAGSDTIRAHFIELAGRDGAVAKNEGDVRQAMSRAVRHIEAIYETPFQAHATMEPMNCTASVKDGRCEVWVSTQSPSRAQETAAGYLYSGIGKAWEKVRRRLGGNIADHVRVHATQVGCGLGRRLEQDYVAEAVQISKAVNAPVKLIWSREEDMQHDFYRPATYNRLAAGIDAQGRLISWHHKIIAPSINESRWPGSIKNGIDHSVVQGAVNMPYRIPNLLVEYVMAKTPVPLGFWRSVGHSHNAFVTECFIDEVADLSRTDPLAFRLGLLAEDSRATAVLHLAAEKSGWGRLAPAGRSRGVAFYHSYGSYVAHVAEISVSGAGEVRVHRVVCAIDCGQVINPDTVAAQMEGSVAFGLTATLKSQVTLRNGRVEQSGFNDFPLLRMSEMPRVEVHIVPSREAPGGAGEPGVPPVAPAVVNAIHAATGRRVRYIPVRAEHLMRATKS